MKYSIRIIKVVGQLEQVLDFQEYDEEVAIPRVGDLIQVNTWDSWVIKSITYKYNQVDIAVIIRVS